MNVFIIPSWYPSKDNPLNGTFIEEQTYNLCGFVPNINIGVSLWGQKDNQTLLWLKDHIWNIPKIFSASLVSTSTAIIPNLTIYKSPTYIWSRKIFKGNLKGIIRANMNNIEQFVEQYGRVDLIHAHVGYPAGRIALELGRKLHIPYIITEHMIPFPSHYDTDKQGNLTSYYRQPYMQAAANVAVGESLRKTMISMGLPNVKTIPNFIDETLFKSLNNISKLSLPSKFTFLTVCEIIPRKGIDVLLYAIKILSQKGINATFRIGGTGPLIEEYKAMAMKLNIEHCIEWLGPLTRERARNEHQQASAFVLPSHDESMGIVYIEALACGKPIIATRCGGPETIVKDINGILIEKNNPNELAAAILFMMKNYDMYDAHAIRQDFLNRYSKKAVIPQLINLYQEVIRQHQTTP
ncbi:MULTISPECIES: glycosyltransferase [Pontibacter]|uniref:Glycosyltransferase involved in cell wall bisynthesis n=1 Tax=Pontibacter lucknowensis TaxID=1077936 RepID=A0A1N6U2T6_9BACT|nr:MULTISPECIES: glycosyltransferase [Pontibacter]EJF11739.1 Glycosyl transferase, group 1 [Pontibacter sp. BAB1700]SIQ59859.1 Glycosyltransferase involved in cell wall bisynthesis [Pontibacter lucknowensis]